MSNNKSLLQLIAAIWILMFHLWIPVTGTGVELFIQKIGYVGVDIFFFVSAYSLAGRKIEYKSFLKNRFFYIYSKYFLFALIAALYKGWSLVKFVKTITFIDFFTRGGGSFLWFVPAILIVYILYPLFLQWKQKGKEIIVLILWFALCCGISQLLGYKELLIFAGRLPVIMAGYLLKTRELPKWSGIVLTILGVLLLFFFGYQSKLNMPWKEFYFVLGLPLVLGIAQLSSFVKENRVVSILASCSLELYAFQMIVGPKLCSRMYSVFGNALLTNFLGLVILLAMSMIFSQIYDKMRSKFVTIL